MIKLDRLQDAENVALSEVFNLGSGTATRIHEVVNLLAKILNVNKPVKYQLSEFHLRQGDHHHQADLTNVRDHLNWIPKVSLERGLRKLVRSLDE